MSAFLVSDKHINTLLAWANLKRISGLMIDGEILDFSSSNDLQKMAEILLDENYRSLNFRYHSEDKARKIVYRLSLVTLKPVQIIKLCDCLDYQSCETDDWESTNAYKILQRIREHAIRCLPGYDEAEWSIN